MTQIIVDACCNHLGDREILESMIEQAAQCGADFIKFQAFKAENLNKNYPDYHKNHAYYKKVELAEVDYPVILGLCDRYKIKCMFTIFHMELVNFLKALGVEHVKIASPNADDDALIKECVYLFDNIYISCGMIGAQRIKELRDNYPIAHLFYCVSRYPTMLKHINFDKMLEFDGFSDHTIGLIAPSKAICYNMGFIEKHFTLGKHLPGKDHFYSIDPDQLIELVELRNYIKNIGLYKRRFKNDD